MKIKGEIVKDAIESKGWLQKDLAKAAGLSVSNTSCILNGKSCRYETALLVAKVLGISVEDLIEKEA